MLHVENTLRISRVLDESIDIGIIHHDASRTPPCELRDIGIWKSCRELFEAWDLVETEMTEEDFMENLHCHTLTN